jgi:hypothetical protein
MRFLRGGPQETLNVTRNRQRKEKQVPPLRFAPGGMSGLFNLASLRRDDRFYWILAEGVRRFSNQPRLTSASNAIIAAGIAPARMT